MARVWLAAVAAASVAAAAAAAEDPGFADWFSDELRTSECLELPVVGEIPSFVQGTLVQAGPGRFSLGGETVGHPFDGFAKVLRLHFTRVGNATRAVFSTNFLQSGFYLDSMKAGKFAPGMMAAETTPPSRRKNGPMNALGRNDNNFIKPQKVGDSELMTSDTMWLTVLKAGSSEVNYTIAPEIPGSLTEDEHWTGDLLATGMCIQTTMAHGLHDDGGGYLAAAGCQTINMPSMQHYHVLFKIQAPDLQRRAAVARVPVPRGRRPSYMHQNGATENFYVIVAQPVHMNFEKAALGEGLAEGALDLVEGESTLLQVVRMSDGTLAREADAPGFLVGHVVNSYEDGQDIVLDMTTMSVESGGFFRRYLLSSLLNKTSRDGFGKSSLTRVVLKPNGTVHQGPALPQEPLDDMELLVINPGRAGRKHCVVWGVQFSSGGRSFASTALVKRNLCSGERLTAFEEGRYVSEHVFIPRPGATDEDDGALVGLVFDAARGESFAQVVDARTLRRVAEVPLGLRVPFPVHPTWLGFDEAGRAEPAMFV